MFLDAECKVVNDPNREERLVWNDIPLASGNASIASRHRPEGRSPCAVLPPTAALDLLSPNLRRWPKFLFANSVQIPGWRIESDASSICACFG